MLQLILQKLGVNRIDCYFAGHAMDRSCFEFMGGNDIFLKAFQELDYTNWIRVPDGTDEAVELMWDDFAAACSSAPPGTVVVDQPREVRVVRVLWRRYVLFSRKWVLDWDTLREILDKFYSDESTVPREYL